MCEVEGAEEEAEDGRDCEPGPYGPEGHCERYEAADGAYGSHGNGARTVVLPFARKFENVLDPQDEVAGHQAPAAEAGETNVEGEPAVRTCVTLWSILDQGSRRGLQCTVRARLPIELSLLVVRRMAVQDHLVDLRVSADEGCDHNP